MEWYLVEEVCLTVVENLPELRHPLFDVVLQCPACDSR